MKKWEKEILQKQISDEGQVLTRIEKTYKQALSEIEDKILALQAKEQTQSVIYQLKYQRALRKQVGDIYAKMTSTWYGDISSYLKDCYEDSFYSTMYALHQEGIPIVIPFDQKEVAQMTAQDIELYSKKLSNRLYTNTKMTATRTVTQISKGLAMNASYASIARDISMTGTATVNQALRITRTEAHRIQNEVKFKTMGEAKAMGADIVKQWDASIDKRTRPSHAALDGQLREMEQPFKSPVTGHTAMYPGGFGIAGEDINCRCAMLQRARWELDKSEVEKCIGDLDNVTDDRLQEIADKLGISKDELIKKSNGVIESDGSINHAVKATTYNQFKKKYKKKEDTLKVKLQSKLDVAQQQLQEMIEEFGNGATLEDMAKDPLWENNVYIKKYKSLQQEVENLQNQLGMKSTANRTLTKPISDHDSLMKNARRFSDRHEADEYHREKNFIQNRWDNQLSADERHGIVTYTSNAYGDMNRNLRAGTLEKSKYKYDIEQATNGLEKTQIAEDVVVYRGMGGANALSAWTDIAVEKLKTPAAQQSLIGKNLTEKAFMSTGTTAGSAWSGIRLEVYLPKGTQAMYVDPISEYPGEYEILIQRNSTFEVKRIDSDSNGFIKNIVLVLVKQEH